MKEATGEVNMTVITIVAIGLIAGFFAMFWPTIRDKITNTFNSSSTKVENLNDYK